MAGASLVWESLFEAAAQTIVGAVGSYAFSRAVGRFFAKNSFDGAMDLWQRGISSQQLGDGDSVRFDGLVSPYAQLFPGDPLDNGQRWNNIYTFPGKISSAEYQTLEFFAGSDAALRVGSLNGETVVGLYSRYGFIGEGIVGVVPTRLIVKAIPEFFHPKFVGVRARISGTLALCPSQHGYIVQGIAARAGIPLDTSDHRNLRYLQVRKVVPFRNRQAATCSLLGTVWVATESPSEQYVVQYGYLNNVVERSACVSRLQATEAWKDARVYFDELECPDSVTSFRRQFLE